MCFFIFNQIYVPMMVITIATTYEISPIHKMHRANDSIVIFGCFRTSGTDSHNRNVIGHFKRNTNQFESAGTSNGVSA